MCRLLGVSKQAYHKQKGSSAAHKAAMEAFALEYIRDIRKLDRGIGGMKLWYMYKRDFPDRERVGRDRFEDIIHRNGLKVRNKTRKPRTTDSSHGLPVYPNLVYSFIPTAINQLWVSDITYIPVWISEYEYVFCYLSIVTDAYNHEIIGWEVGSTLEAEYTCQALEMAFSRLIGVADEQIKQLIHHSDRGIQYASRDYVKLLMDKQIRISMTENGNPKENAIAERINSTIKDEMLKDMRFTCIREVREALAMAIDFYNTMRPHMSMNMMTPREAASCTGELRKLWKSYRDAAIKNTVA